jgi:hypothetical protein
MTPQHSLLDRLFRKRRTLRGHIGGVPNRTTLFVALVVVFGALAVTAGPALGQSGESPTPTTEANNSTAAPGAAVTSAVSVEGTLLSSDVQRRTLDVELTRAASDKERAAIVATSISTLNDRLDALETRAQRLRDARQADRTSAAVFQASYAPIAAEAEMTDRTLGRLRTAATELPAIQFEAQYTNTTSIDRLDERASVLTNGTSVTAPIPTSTASPQTTDSTTTDGSPATDRPAEGDASNWDDGGDAADGDDDDGNESDEADDSDGMDDRDTDDDED